MSRFNVAFLFCALVAVLAASCCRAGQEVPLLRRAEPTATQTPIPSPTPTPTATPTPPPLLPVRGEPSDLALGREDLPPGMQLVVQESDGPQDYTVVYFRPASLTTDDPSRLSLLGVTVNLGVYRTAAMAQAQFAVQGNLDVESIADTFIQASEDAKLIEAQPVDVELQGVDRLSAFRVHYAIELTQVVDYRFRFTVHNALANVIVTARAVGTGQDPDRFRERALEIAGRQAAYLNEARH